MKLRLNQPSVLIDIAKIKELNFIRDRGKFIAIGAGTTHGTIASHKTVMMKIPLLGIAAELIGDVQVRNMGTIGGSIAHADPAADWPAVLIAANATIEVQGAFGERRIPADDFFTGFFSTELRENEIITEIHVPEPNASNLRYAYAKYMQPASRFAIVGCAVQLEMGENDIVIDARVAFNGVSSRAYRAKSVEAALIGQTLTDDVISMAAQYAVDGADMVMSDHFAGEAYRAKMAAVYCKRALQSCVNAC